MKKLVIIPGGFHPFHAGHMALYNAAREAFPSADIYVAATDDTSTRPFPFAIKEKLARLAGIPAHRFIKVKSPFQAREITQHFDPENTQLIFVRSEKDRGEKPQPGGMKKDGSPGYLQPYQRNGLMPMNQHGYMAYLPTVQFGPGMTSATEIRGKWPGMDDTQKSALVNVLYPTTQNNEKLTSVVKKMLDTAMGVVAKSESIEEEQDRIVPQGGLGSYTPEALEKAVAEHMMDVIRFMKSGEYDKVDYMLYKWGVIESKVKALKDYYEKVKSGQESIDEDYISEKWSNKYKKSIDCNNPKGFSQKAHCAARRKRAAGGKTKSQPVK